jgi:protein SCO1
MTDLSRRNLFGIAAVAPLTGLLLPELASGATRKSVSKTRLTPRERIQQLHLPNVPLVTQDGRSVYFYDDLVKDKIVTINFFYSRCDEICPLVTANLVKVQRLLGDRVGRDVFMHSITLKPEEDSPDTIKKYADAYHVKPGWTFYTGKPEDIERLRKGLGFTYPEPAIDKDKTQHIGNVRYGNERLTQWAACPGMARPETIVESVSWMFGRG